DDAALRQARAEVLVQLREVAVERAQVAALDVDVVAVAEHDRAEAVPLRLEEPAVPRGQLGRELREHRLDRRRYRKPRGVRGGHQRAPVSRAAIRPSADAQPASSGCPASSMSTSSGAWFEGVGLPLRASRSISAHTVRPATLGVASRWSIRMPKFLWKLPAR